MILKRLTLNVMTGCGWALLILVAISWIFAARSAADDLVYSLTCEPSSGPTYDPDNPLCDERDPDDVDVTDGDIRILIFTVIGFLTGGILAAVLTPIVIWRTVHRLWKKIKTPSPAPE